MRSYVEEYLLKLKAELPDIQRFLKTPNVKNKSKILPFVKESEIFWRAFHTYASKMTNEGGDKRCKLYIHTDYRGKPFYKTIQWDDLLTGKYGFSSINDRVIDLIKELYDLVISHNMKMEILQVCVDRPFYTTEMIYSHFRGMAFDIKFPEFEDQYKAFNKLSELAQENRVKIRLVFVGKYIHVQPATNFSAVIKKNTPEMCGIRE